MKRFTLFVSDKLKLMREKINKKSATLTFRNDNLLYPSKNCYFKKKNCKIVKLAIKIIYFVYTNHKLKKKNLRPRQKECKKFKKSSFIKNR